MASTLVAGGRADTLYVTGIAGTTLTGGAGHDNFAFPNVMGKDEVANFGFTKDTLQFNTTLFSNFTAAMNAAARSPSVEQSTHIRVASKQELKDRIIAAMNYFNQDPVVHTWAYKLDNAA